MTEEGQHPGEWIPSTEADRKAVLSQLERMLESSLFRNSKRYPNLLRFLVEQVLAGNDALLKERTLGVTVFHRSPDYDTNQDTVVRLAAGEVRKRIAQYYHQPEHTGQLQIDLRPGSYVPVFRHPDPVSAIRQPRSQDQPCEDFAPARNDTAEPMAPSNGLPEAAEPQPSVVPPVIASAPRRTAVFPAGWRTLAAVVVLLALGAGSLFWWNAKQAERTADRQLWAPILQEPGQVRLVISDQSATLSYARGQQRQQAGELEGVLRMGELVNYRDSLALSGIVGSLAQHNKPYTLELSTQATYPELQSGASVLVGGLSNVWTMRVTSPLRYHFVRRPDSYVFGIEDRQHPELGGWNLDLAQPSDRGSEDYAIVARIFDQTTGRPVLVVAGLGANGTAAAAQFLLDPARTAELSAHAPRDWQRLNMEAVIRTQILDNHAGPPHLVACTFW
ncbi:MAG: hypothetical protein P4K86_13025 [Terracidiphilus sp.]|nr:hypothetical protein [Terracidiphilus sp.]MDR3775824.1 hypothetical protein [Terracidiphilus sp.]